MFAFVGGATRRDSLVHLLELPTAKCSLASKSL